MNSFSKLIAVSVALSTQLFFGSARAEVPAECSLNSEEVAALKANKDNMQGLIDQIRGENDLDKRYKLLQQHLAEMKQAASALDQQYKSLIDVCGKMSSPREDAIIQLLEQRINLLQVVVYQLVQHNEEFESPYKSKGRPW
jgi:hypothetical protein